MNAIALALLAAEPSLGAMFGVGSYSCAKAHQSENTEAAFAWVISYVTGGDVAEQAVARATTDRRGIMEPIKAVCDADPTLNLTSAAERVYGELLPLLRPVAKQP